MSKIMMTKKEFEATRQAPEMETCCSGNKGISLFSILAVIAIATSAISWVALMNLKQSGGKLPWEQE